MPPRPRIGLLEPFTFSSSASTTLCSHCVRHASKSRLTRSFSSTPSPQATRMRRRFYQWLNGPGENFRNPLPGSTNYLNAYDAQGNLFREMKGDQDGEDPEAAEEREEQGLSRESRSDLQVFLLNRHFISESVLSEEHKDAIWKLVKEKGKSVREVSNLLGVDMNRVGAVVRLKGVEMDWKKQGKPLANAYNRAILDMVPVTKPPRDLVNGGQNINTEFAHESINDLNVHRATKEQIFFPASESRQFTRVDAGNVFEKGLLPADERIPHPEAIEYYRDRKTQDKRERSTQELRDFYAEEIQQRELEKTRRRERKAKNTITVEGDRAVFQITNVTVDEHTVGMNGRGVKGVGVRYGFPHEDRKKGTVKIPTRVR